MILINMMKNLKIYKTPLFLPTLENDKKKHSAILMMTPNYKMSGYLMTHKIFVNKLRFSSYYFDKDVSYLINAKNSEEEVEESTVLAESVLVDNPAVFSTGDKVFLFNEDAKNDAQLRKLLYTDRIKTRKEVLAKNEQVMKDYPFIKYAYPELDRYQGKNIYVDLSYYIDLFFQNNTWVLNKGMNLFLDLCKRLIDNPKLKSNGYTKRTVFIPVHGWAPDEVPVWNYKSMLNPISVIYQLMYSSNTKIIDTFGDLDFVFVGNTEYFKINFKELKDEKEDLKKASMKLKLFVTRILNKEEFDPEDVDTTADNFESPEVVQAKLVDRIELAKGVDITPNIATSREKKEKLRKELASGNKSRSLYSTSKNTKADKAEDEKKEAEQKKNLSKGTITQTNSDADKLEIAKQKMADTIEDITTDKNGCDEDRALDMMDTEYIKQMLLDLDSKAEDRVDISTGRAARITQLDRELMDKSVKGRSIRDILDPEAGKQEEEIMELELSTPNEEWKNLSYVNFDKNYDIERDIIRCFKHFKNTTHPIAIRNIEVTNNSTSEDRVDLYKVEMEDYRGKRFTVKLDIPIMEDNRFLLRGNYKTIQTQFFNMPIIKTDFDTCQIISNYMKIFVRRFGSGSGKSLPLVSRILKVASKYKGNKIKFEFGDNSKVANKYELPIDYIDLSSAITKIETDDVIVYFNQDDIRNIYEVKDEYGIPYAYEKKGKRLLYIDANDEAVFSYQLIGILETADKNFSEALLATNSSSISAYSRCSIMNSQIPMVVICGYHEGLRKTMQKAHIEYELYDKLTKDLRHSIYTDYIKFSDGYLVYKATYEASMLLNGLKECPTELYTLADMDNQNMYLEFLDLFGGRIKVDGLENFYDCMVDPLTQDALEFYKFPTDYISILLYANALLADNKFVRHTDTSSRSYRRYKLITVYTYKVLADTYSSYANQLKHSRDRAEFYVTQDAVITKFLTDTITSDDSCINALRDVEATNSVTTKGPSGMNSDRAYSLDKRTYDESMLNVLGMSTGFAANAGITRQATINSNITADGYVKTIKGNTELMNTANTLTVTEALTPFGSTHDDPIRTAMTFVQTAKHMVRTEDSDPLLVTNGVDEALPYLTTNKFAYKAKRAGKVLEVTDEIIIIEYDNGKKEYINLAETIEKNSDGGYFVPLKLDANKGIKAGAKFKKNDILAYDRYSFSNTLGESDTLAYNIGKLAKIAIINTDEGFEDSGVISEAMAKKLATRINLKYDIVLDKDTNLLEFLKVGDHVECGDALMIWQAPFDDEETNNLLKALSSDEVSELGKRKLKSEVTGTVTAIKIFRTVEKEDLSESLRAFVDDYEKKYDDLEAKLKSHEIDTSRIPAHYKLEPTGKLKKAQDAILVEFYVEYLDTVGVGDKVVYFSANKAVEKNVIPEGLEPYTAFRPNEKIDAFVSETSIDKRMVTSTIIIGSLQKLMIELDRSVKDIMGIPYDDSTV